MPRMRLQRRSRGKEEAAADAPAKKKKDKGPEPNLGGPPMAKQANALGFVVREGAAS